MDIRLVLTNAGVTDDHLGAFGAAVSEAYGAIKALSETVPMLGITFLPGHRMLGYLRNAAVQHALYLKSKDTGLFTTQEGWNANDSHAFLQLNVGKVRFTAHYLGPRGARGIRGAIFRSELQRRNYDLFAAERKNLEIHYNGDIYAHIVHGGVFKPAFSAIRIPSRDGFARRITTFTLEAIEPSVSKVEEVKDRISETMKKRRRGKFYERNRDAS